MYIYIYVIICTYIIYMCKQSKRNNATLELDAHNHSSHSHFLFWFLSPPTFLPSWCVFEIGWHRILRLFLKLFNIPDFCPWDLWIVSSNTMVLTPLCFSPGDGCAWPQPNRATWTRRAGKKSRKSSSIVIDIEYIDFWEFLQVKEMVRKQRSDTNSRKSACD